MTEKRSGLIWEWSSLKQSDSYFSVCKTYSECVRRVNKSEIIAKFCFKLKSTFQFSAIYMHAHLPYYNPKGQNWILTKALSNNSPIRESTHTVREASITDNLAVPKAPAFNTDYYFNLTKLISALSNPIIFSDLWIAACEKSKTPKDFNQSSSEPFMASSCKIWKEGWI